MRLLNVLTARQPLALCAHRPPARQASLSQRSAARDTFCDTWRLVYGIAVFDVADAQAKLLCMLHPLFLGPTPPPSLRGADSSSRLR